MQLTHLSVLTVVVVTAAAKADTLHVPGQFPTIQAAIVAANPGDEVLVAAGTYTQNINFLGKAITVRSADGPDVTTIEAANTMLSVVAFITGEGPDSVLRGFTITGAVNPINGGGINCNTADPTIIDCLVTANAATLGGGMRLSDSQATIRRCTFFDNSAGPNGGGAHVVDGAVVFEGCRFLGNDADDGGGLTLTGDAVVTMVSCEINGNSAIGFGGGVNVGALADVTIVGCTFYDNSAGTTGGALFKSAGSSVALSSSIIWSNSADPVAPIGPTLSVHHCSLGIAFPGTGNIAGDPGFADGNGGNGPDNVSGTLDDDTRPNSGSPTIDQGSNADHPSCTVDLDGNERTHDSPMHTDCTTAPGTCGTAPIMDMGCYEWLAASGDANGNGVLDACDPIYNTTANTAHDTIQEAIDQANGGDEITVAPGTYVETIDFAGQEITLRSTDGPTVTTLDGDGVDGPVVTCSTGEFFSTVLEGFMITGADGDDATALLLDGTSPQIDDCIFADNISSQGAAVRATQSNASFTDCVFDTNTASGSGGAVTVSEGSLVTFTSCEFGNNDAGDCGGAVDTAGSVTFGDCLFFMNTATQGGAIFADGDPTAVLTITGTTNLVGDSTPGLVSGMTMSGDGFGGTADMQNWGTIHPDGSTMIAGSLRQQPASAQTDTAGVIELDISGLGCTQVDGIDIGGEIIGEGTLILGLADMCTPTLGQMFTIGTFDTFTGPFHMVSSPVFGPTLDIYLQVDYVLPSAVTGPTGLITATATALTTLIDLDDPESASTSNDPSAADVGDFNGDGALDVVVTTRASDSLFIVLNAGTIGPGGTVAAWSGWDSVLEYRDLVGADPSDVAVADFDPGNDNGDDVAVSNRGDSDVSVLINTGEATLDFDRTDVGVGGEPNGITVASFTGADFDLVTANGDGSLTFLDNNSGGGTFTPINTIILGLTPDDIDPGCDDDPKDLTSECVVGMTGGGGGGGLQGPGAPRVSVHLNDGFGTYGAGTIYAVGEEGETASDIELGDLTGDGLHEIVVSNVTAEALAILVNEGDDTFDGGATKLVVGGEPGDLTLGDYDADGDLDISVVVTPTGGGSTVVKVFENLCDSPCDGSDPDAQFVLVETSTGGADDPVLVETGDIDNDAVDDLVIVTKSLGPSIAGPGITSGVLGQISTAEAPCTDGDGQVDTVDFLALLGAWGPNPGHPADLNGDDIVDTVDFLTLLGAWGPCPGGTPCCEGDIAGGT